MSDTVFDPKNYAILTLDFKRADYCDKYISLASDMNKAIVAFYQFVSEKYDMYPIIDENNYFINMDIFNQFLLLHPEYSSDEYEDLNDEIFFTLPSVDSYKCRKLKKITVVHNGEVTFSKLCK